MARPMQYLTLPMILVLLGAILGAVGVFLATFRQNQEKVQSALQRAQFETELRAKSDEIAKLNHTIAESITGGDSYCYLQLGNANRNNALLAIIHQGNYPMYDVTVRIVDLDEFEQNRGAPNLASALGKVVPIGNLAPGQASMQGPIILPNRDILRYNIFISARNGMFTQLLRMLYVNGTWKSAMRVQKDNYSDADPDAQPTILKEEIDPQFPRNRNGQVEW
jgi:hypothetical protein